MGVAHLIRLPGEAGSEPPVGQHCVRQGFEPVLDFGDHHLTEDYPLHIHHREDEGIYMFEGRMTAVVGDDSFSLGPGGFVFMPRGVPHSLSRASETPVRFVFVSTPGGFEHLREDIVELVGDGHPPSPSEWQALEAKHGWAWL